MSLRGPKRWALVAGLSALLGAGCSRGPDVLSLHGTGASLPMPLYSRWVVDFESKAPQVRLNYQALGSGAGIKQMIAGTVDFGATDTPMQDEELRRCPSPMAHVPTTLGAVVIAFNVDGVKELDLDGPTLAAIFMGEIRDFGDARVRALNPTLTQMTGPITVVHRSDGSGTTRVLTEYLAQTSATWREQVGAGGSVRWPTGIGAKGNEGVGAQLAQIPFALGYVEEARARRSALGIARLKNRAGNFVRASTASVTAAALGADLPADLRANITNAPGDGAYPLSTFSFVIVPQDNPSGPKGKALAQFLWWAIHDGQRAAGPLHYTPLPAAVVTRAETVVQGLRAQGQPVELSP
jgi:phosphate transport system substrate-binding protein